jgi:methionine-gamma-lyase
MADIINEIRLVGMKDMTGAVMAPFNALLVQRGLKTLALRMERHSHTAQQIAEWLSVHPAVGKVSFPGLPHGQQYDIAQKQMSLSGGMIAFEMTGGIAAGRELMNSLGMIQRAVSLGDAETLIQHPASMTHSTYTPEERAHHEISDGLVRLSIGLEDVQDILADLDQALSPRPMAMTG